MSFTIISCFFDIGREDWLHYQRSISDYLENLKNFCQLNYNFIFYTETKFISLIHSYRKDFLDKTMIICIDIPNLKMFTKYTQIVNAQKSITNHPNMFAPEVCKPLYNLVVCSKLDLIYKTTKLNPFNSEYFIWMDGGYTHNTINLSNFEYNPKSIISLRDKISVICLNSLDRASNDPKEFYYQYIDVLIGGFFGGGREAIEKIHTLYYSMIEDILEEYNIIDDDQYYWTLSCKKYPELFNVVYGNWYDGVNIK